MLIQPSNSKPTNVSNYKALVRKNNDAEIRVFCLLETTQLFWQLPISIHYEIANCETRTFLSLILTPRLLTKYNWDSHWVGFFSFFSFSSHMLLSSHYFEDGKRGEERERDWEEEKSYSSSNNNRKAAMFLLVCRVATATTWLAHSCSAILRENDNKSQLNRQKTGKAVVMA